MVLPIDLVLVRHGESEGTISFASKFGRLLSHCYLSGNLAHLMSRNGDHSPYENPDFVYRHSSLWRLSETGRQQAKVHFGTLQQYIYNLFRLDCRRLGERKCWCLGCVFHLRIRSRNGNRCVIGNPFTFGQYSLPHKINFANVGSF